MDFIDEEHVALLQVGQDPRQISRFLDLGTGGSVNVGLRCAGDDVGQSRLAQSGGAGEQDMLEHILALTGCFHHQHEALLDLFLPVELPEPRRAQGEVEGGLRFLVRVIRHLSRLRARFAVASSPQGPRKRRWRQGLTLARLSQVR